MLVLPSFNNDPQRRAHPWTVTEYSDKGGRYYDFKSTPELIPTVLEDFVPFNERAAIQRFYDLLREINRAGGLLETNDCAFEGPQPLKNILFKKPVEMCGRLEVLMRSAEANVNPNTITFLIRMFHIYLSLEQPNIHFVVFETHRCMTDYVDIGQIGERLSITFRAFGDNDDEAFQNLDYAFIGLRRTFQRIEDAMQNNPPDFP